MSFRRKTNWKIQEKSLRTSKDFMNLDFPFLTNRSLNTIIINSYEKGREKEEYVFRAGKRGPFTG